MPTLGEVLDSLLMKKLNQSEMMYYLYAFVYHVKMNSTLVILEMIRSHVEEITNAENTSV